MGRTATVAQVASIVEALYPPRLAEEWDAVGLVCGDPDASVRRILLAIDPVLAVADEALVEDVQLLLTHHPLLLRGVHSVAATWHGGRVVQTLVSHGIALMSAHTNADVARPGVSDALAEALGLVDLVPLAPLADDPHLGLGRVGVLPEAESLGAFADRVAAALPATAHGVRVAGDLAAPVRRVAVCGGAGDSLLEQAAASGADAYVTADLRHHRALDHRVDGGCALVDVAHWASEWPWLEVAARRLAAALAEAGATVDVHVSRACTDPWTAHRGSDR